MFKILGYIYQFYIINKKNFLVSFVFIFFAMLFEPNIVSVSLLNIFSDIDKSIFAELNFLNFEKDVLVLIFIALVSFIF